MSNVHRWVDLEPATRESIRINTVNRCGCEQLRHGLSVHLCNYHQAFDDGADAAINLYLREEQP